MSNKKSGGKKHNADKRATKFFQNARLWSWESQSTNGKRFVEAETKCCISWTALTPRIANKVVASTNNWLVCCRAVLMFPDGSTAIESEEVQCRNKKVNDFAEVYDEMRARVLASAQEAHIVDVGWICQTFQTQAQLDKINIERVHVEPVTILRQMQWQENKDVKPTN